MSAKLYANPLHGPSSKNYEAHSIVHKGTQGLDVSQETVNPFLSWSVHELQELLMNNYHSPKIQAKVMHTHLKHQLANLALHLCKAKFGGIVPAKPAGHREMIEVSSDIMYVKRSRKAYETARGMQQRGQEQFRSYASGHAYLHKHDMAPHIGYGPGGGSTSHHVSILTRNISRNNVPVYDDTDSEDDSDDGDAPKSLKGTRSYRRGTVVRIAEHRALQAGEAPPPPPLNPSSSSARRRSGSTAAPKGGWEPPSRLKAMAYAVEHSPRDWPRYEREQMELAEIKVMENKLKAMSNEASTKSKDEGSKSKKRKSLKKAEKERKLLEIKLHRLQRKARYEGPEDVDALREMDKDGIYRHAYQVPKYSCCCGTPLGRHCPHIVFGCSKGSCGGRRGCQIDVCGAFCDPCGEGSYGTFTHHGVGIGLYFKFLKWLGFTTFFMFLVVLPEVIINTFGVSKGAMLQDNNLNSLSLGNLGELNTTIAVPCWTQFFSTASSKAHSQLDSSKNLDLQLFCEVSRSDIAHLYATLDCIAMGVFFLSYLWLRHSEHAERAHFEGLRSVTSVADYTLLVTSFPEDILIKSSAPEKIVEEEKHAEAWLMQFFEHQVRAACKDAFGSNDDATLRKHQLMDSADRVVHSVIVATDQASSINFQRKMAPKRKKIDALEWRIKELIVCRDFAKAEGNQRSAQNLTRAIFKKQRERKRLILKMQRAQRGYRAKRIVHEHVPKMVAAFVTFATDMGKRLIYRRYGKGGRCHRYCCQRRELRYHGLASRDSPESVLVTRVALKNAPEPSTMLWQNLGYGLAKRLCRRFLTFFIATSVVMAAAVLVYFARSSDPSQLGRECLGTPVFSHQTNKSSSIVNRVGAADSIFIFGQEFSCDGWVRDVARTSEYGDLSLACSQYGEKISLARLRKTNASSLERTCGCYLNAVKAVQQGDTDTIGLCESYITFVGINSALQGVAVMSVIFVNILYVIVSKKLGSYEGHHSLDGQESSVAFRVLLGSVLNTGFVLLLVNARISKDGVLASIFLSGDGHSGEGVDVSSILRGKYPDFTADWFSDVGVALTVTMMVYVFSPHLPPLLRFCKFSCTEKTSSTQAGLNSLYVGPDFHHSIRYPQVCVVVFVSMTYSTGMPILYLVITTAAFTFYWVDKYLFTRWYRTPPQYDARISLQFSSYLPWAMLLHFLFGTWMLANRRMFSSDHSSTKSNGDLVVSSGNMSASAPGVDNTGKSDSIHFELLGYLREPNGAHNDIVGSLMQEHVGPMLVAMSAVLIFIVLRKLWGFIGPLLRRCVRLITCKRCGGHPVVVLKDDYINEEAHMRQYGLADYNIFANPIYQMMFNVDAEFADTHAHLESLALKETEKS